MEQEGKRTLSGILLELMKELTRLEAIAYTAAQYMGERGLEDEASTLWDLCTVARDWLDEVMTWVANLVQGKEGGDE